MRGTGRPERTRAMGAESGAAKQTDVAVIGGTPAGIAAAIAAARAGLDVVLVEPSRHLGGLMTNGLGATDIRPNESVGGIFGVSSGWYESTTRPRTAWALRSSRTAMTATGSSLRWRSVCWRRWLGNRSGWRSGVDGGWPGRAGRRCRRAGAGWCIPNRGPTFRGLTRRPSAWSQRSRWRRWTLRVGPPANACDWRRGCLWTPRTRATWRWVRGRPTGLDARGGTSWASRTPGWCTKTFTTG